MSQADQTAKSTDARQASMARVTTLADLVKPADAPPTEETAKANGEQGQTETRPKKSSFSERITEVIAQRKAAEEEASRAKREAEELRAQLDALKAQAEPVKESEKPVRSQFATEDEYLEALADYKASQRIAAREREQAEARAKAEFETVTRTWEKRCEAAVAEIPDFAEALESSEVQVVDYVSQTLLRSEMGPQLAYFFAKHPEEARKVNRMHPVEGIRYITRLERDLSESEEPKNEPAKAEKTVERSKAPPPITTVRQSAPLDPGPASSYAEYRARRKAQQSR